MAEVCKLRPNQLQSYCCSQTRWQYMHWALGSPRRRTPDHRPVPDQLPRFPVPESLSNCQRLRRLVRHPDQRSSSVGSCNGSVIPKAPNDGLSAGAHEPPSFDRVTAKNKTTNQATLSPGLNEAAPAYIQEFTIRPSDRYRSASTSPTPVPIINSTDDCRPSTRSSVAQLPIRDHRWAEGSATIISCSPGVLPIIVSDNGAVWLMQPQNGICQHPRETCKLQRWTTGSKDHLLRA